MSAPDKMLYNPAAMDQLQSELNHHAGRLQSIHGDMHNAHAKLSDPTVWTGAGQAQYAHAFAKVSKDLEDIHQTLHAGIKATHQAHEHAIHGDNQVRRAFGG
jgi:WXG100 family type VII secretion target